MKEEFSKCRVCCLEIDESICSFQPVRDYQEKLTFVAGVILFDYQPQNICSGCIDELEVSYNFKKKCEQAETFFVQEIIKPETKLFVDETFPLEEPFVAELDDNVSEDIEDKDDIVMLDLPSPTSEPEETLDEDNKKEAKKKTVKQEETVHEVECEECFVKYLNYDSLRVHYRRKHKNKKAYSCEKCRRNFYTKVQTEEHESQCRKRVHDPSDSSSKEKPKKSIDGENWSFCPYCGKVMGSRYLTRHINDIHLAKKNAALDLICDLCGERYRTKAGMIDHMKRKHLLAEYRCNFCNEIFSSYGIKRNHEIHFHTFKYKYECNICHHKFIVNRDYKKHLITHTGEKNYLCTICGMRLSRKSVLDLHMATHTDIRPHICKICKATFKTTKSLKVHQMVHEERKYECPVCQQRFLVNQAMRQHVQKRHPEFELPPPGTIMNKRALQRIEEISTKYNIKVNTASFHPLPSKKVAEETKETGESISAKSLINSNFQKKVTKTKMPEMEEESTYQISLNVMKTDPS